MNKLVLQARSSNYIVPPYGEVDTGVEFKPKVGRRKESKEETSFLTAFKCASLFVRSIAIDNSWYS